MGAGEPEAGPRVEEGAREEGLLVVTVAAEGSEAPEVWVTVTADTLGARPCELSAPVSPVAALTGEQVMRSTDADRSKVMVDRLVRLPAVERMAACAVGASFTLVYIEVTPLAALRELAVLVLDVALSAALLTVEPFKGISTLALVVESDLIPSGRAVTLFAGLGELPLVEILMAVRAAGVYRLKLPITVTAVTVKVLMLPFEGKAAELMIKGLDRP